MKSGPLWLLLFLFCIINRPLEAQFFVNGESPASVQWMQIRTPQFEVVFPVGVQKDAERLISNLEKTGALTQKPYTRPAKRLPILLNTTSVRSNGFVTWTPRRMELTITPPQDSYAQDWIGQLSLHEYRHVVQISQLDQGFIHGLSFLTGEIAMGVGTAIMPSWYYEGDAVVNETDHSDAGRGRIAGFEMPVRTLLLGNHRLYPYSKALLGSYRDFVPDQYQYGYQMIRYTNSHYGEGIWPGAIGYSARHAYFLSPLAIYFILKHKTGKGPIYLQTMDSIKTLYNKQEESITYRDYLIKNKRKPVPYTNYKFPHMLAGGNLLALKTGINQRACFVVIDPAGHEKNIFTPGAISELRTDLHGQYVVWDEITSDPRWALRNYSEIRLFDMSRGKAFTLTRRTRYFCPVFSPDGNTIAVSETDLQDRHYITLLDAKNGKCLRRIHAPGNREITFPAWDSDSTVLAVTVAPGGKQIEQVDLRNGEWKVLLPYTRFDISEPVHFRNYILFRSAYNGIENIYAIDVKGNQLYQVTFSRFGAYNPSVSPDSATLVFSSYTEQGFNICETPVNPSDWEGLKDFQNHGGLYVPHGIWAETRRTDYSEDLPGDSLESPARHADPYNKMAHLFNVHSWLPFYVPLDNLPGRGIDVPVELGLMLFSQNLLSNFISSIGYHYSNGYNYFTPHFTWRGWYPVIELSGQVGGPFQSYPYPEGIHPGQRFSIYYDYHLKTYVPLTFDRGKYITYLLPQVEYEHNSTHFYLDGAEQNGLNYMHYFLYATRYLRLSTRDLYPRLGGYVSASYTNTPDDKGLLGSLFSLQGGLYLPGIGNHHHLLLKGGWQKQDPGIYYLSINRINFPRGYVSDISAEIKTFSIDYAMPLAYPDFSAGPILYLKRIRADLFYDWSYGNNIVAGSGTRYTGAYRSSGAELLADFHAGRVIFPLSAGLRTGYLFNQNRMFTEFLFNIRMR